MAGGARDWVLVADRWAVASTVRGALPAPAVEHGQDSAVPVPAAQDRRYARLAQARIGADMCGSVRVFRLWEVLCWFGSIGRVSKAGGFGVGRSVRQPGTQRWRRDSKPPLS
jgi:hypothetical protein